MKKIIAVTGPESTAKSTLSKELSSYFNGSFFPEYAREYLANKGHDYTYLDVVEIAKQQIVQYEKAVYSSSELVFFDTWLIITKVWFDWVFQKVPDWLEKAIEDHPVDLYLLCKPDIPWEPDPLRENGGEERVLLYNAYKNELVTRGFHFIEIDGIGEQRIDNAINAVKSTI